MPEYTWIPIPEDGYYIKQIQPNDFTTFSYPSIVGYYFANHYNVPSDYPPGQDCIRITVGGSTKGEWCFELSPGEWNAIWITDTSPIFQRGATNGICYISSTNHQTCAYRWCPSTVDGMASTVLRRGDPGFASNFVAYFSYYILSGSVNISIENSSDDWNVYVYIEWRSTGEVVFLFEDYDHSYGSLCAFEIDSFIRRFEYHMYIGPAHSYTYATFSNYEDVGGIVGRFSPEFRWVMDVLPNNPWYALMFPRLLLIDLS